MKEQDAVKYRDVYFHKNYFINFYASYSNLHKNKNISQYNNIMKYRNTSNFFWSLLILAVSSSALKSQDKFLGGTTTPK